MPEIVQTGDGVSLVTPPLVLAFRWDGRRWTHELSAGGRALAGSLEWEPERDDPARVVSPGYQQLSTQEGPAGVQALLVGQWGPHHGSAVFTVNDQAGGVVVEADVAVRSRSPLQCLASTYLVHLTSGDLSDAGPSAVLWDVPAPTAGRLRFEPGGPAGGRTRVALAEAGRRGARVQATAETEPGTATHRLQYRWRWEPTADRDLSTP